MNAPAYHRLKPYQGIGVFVLVMLVLPLVAAPIQRRWGIYGLAISELIILLLAVIPAIVLKADLKAVFPIRKPSLRQAFGVFILWAGSYLGVLLITLVLAYFFPEELLRVSGGIQRTFTSVPFGIAFFIVAIMPAICEEALHRGLILSSLNSIRRKWIVVLTMGIIFGIFHLDLYRFLPTALLGMVITYIMVETGNLALPVLFHFINNGFTTFVAFASQSQAAPPRMDAQMLLMAMAVYLIIGSVVPFLLLWGSRLIHGGEPAGDTDLEAMKRSRKMDRLAVVCAAIMLLSGVAILTFNFAKALISSGSLAFH